MIDFKKRELLAHEKRVEIVELLLWESFSKYIHLLGFNIDIGDGDSIIFNLTIEVIVLDNNIFSI